MKRKLSFLLAIVFVLTLAFNVLPGVPAEAAVSDYTLDQKIDPPTQNTYSYAGSNIIVVKQGNYAFIWKDSTITDNDTTLKSIVAGLDSSVNTSRCFVTTSTSFWLNGFSGLSGDSQFNFQVTINTTTKLVTVQKFEWQKQGRDWVNVPVAGFVSHIDLISYDPVTYGKLKVMKNVSGTGASTTQEFSISLVFTIGSKGSLSDIQFDSKSSGASYSGSNGSYTLTLADDEYVSFKNIPVGTTYTVSETVSLTGWTGPSNYTGTITDTTQKLVTVENKYTPPPQYGSLEIKKLVETSGAPTGVSFTMTVTFSGNLVLSPLPAGVTNLGNGQYSFSLTNGSNVVFEKIPVGTSYTVAENLTAAQIGAGWKTPVVSYDDNDLIKAIDFNNDDDHVTVKNTYKAPETGSLTIAKALDAQGDTTYGTSPNFTIHVVFTGPYLDGIVPPTGPNNASGVYDVSLPIGGSATFTNIPVDVTYVVTEPSMPSTAWTNSSIINNDNQLPYNTIDSKDDSDTVTVTNKYTETPYGTLTIDKVVTATDADGTVPFEITVAFSGLGVNEILKNGIETSATGSFTFTLSGNGAPVVFSHIPMNTGYTVLETRPTLTGWEYVSGEVTAQAQALITSTTNVNVVITNHFTPPSNPDYGMLKIDKIVTGTDADGSTPFEITVAFTGTSEDISGILKNGTDTSSTGSFTFTLTGDGAPVVFSNIPMGTGYTVLETRPTLTGWAYAGGEVTSQAEASITSTTLVLVEITNHYTPPSNPEYGTLTVTKEVNTGADQTKEFEMQVTFYGEGASLVNPPEGATLLTPIDSVPQAPSLNSQYSMTYVIYLHHGETAQFTNIPFGVQYTVEETEQLVAPWSYMSGEVPFSANAHFDTENPSDTVKIVNNYNPPVIINYGILTISKAVTGANASPTEKFDFTVTFTPGAPDYWNVLGIAAPAGAMGVGNGTYKLSLSASDGPVTFSNIPVGTTYTVTEDIKTNQVKDGWTLESSSGTTGAITAAGATALITNTIGGVAGESDDGGDVAGETEKLPQTGGISSSTLIGLFGLALIAIGGTSITIFRKKNDSRSK